MRRLMEKAHLGPPTFESNRESNEFTARLLLHHFLDENDLEWLKQFENTPLKDSQKQALIFVREVGAIDNITYRQMANCDTLKASNDLRFLRNNNFLKVKGKGKSTYYISGNKLSTPPQEISTPPQEIRTPPQEILDRINALKKREHNKNKIELIVLDLCSIKPMKAIEIAGYFQKEEAYFKRKYLSSMIAEKKLKYLYPEMINHPEQAYLTNNRK